MKIAVIALLASAALSSAHDLYLLPSNFHPQPGDRVAVSFHNGDSFPESEVAPKPERLVEAQLRSPMGSVAITGLRVQGNETTGSVVVPGAGALLLSVQTIPNLIEVPPAKFTDYLKEEGLTDVIAWRAAHAEDAKPGRERYQKFAKSLLHAGSGEKRFATHALGLTIEIVPAADPAQLQAGEELPVQVLFRGKPAADLQVEIAYAGKAGNKTVIAGRTGSDGRLSVSLPHPGLYRLHALRMERCSHDDESCANVDWESYWASFTFERR